MRKLIITTTVLMFLFLNIIPVKAGKTKGKVSTLGPKSPMISVSLNGNGGTSPSTGVSNAFNFNPNAGIEVVWMNFGFGIDASTFSTKSNFDFDAYAAPLKSLDYINTTISSNNWRSTSILFGPSYTIPFGLSNPIPGIGIVVKRNYPIATLTLSVKGGVTMNQAPDFLVVDNATPQKTIAITNADAFKKNVLTFKPSIVFAYWLSENFAVNLNANYVIQSGQGEFITKYRDLSKVDFNSTKVDLTRQQITSAPVISSTTKGPEKFMSFGVGLTYRFGKGWDGSIKGGKAERKGWDGSIKGNVAEKKGITENGLKKNETENATKAADIKVVAETEASRKGINEGGLKKNEAQRKGINENGLKKNETAYLTTDAEIKAIAEALVNMRKGWDGSIKGNKVESASNAEVKAIAETLVNLARKGWDGSIKGNKVEYDTKAA
ncbi:MAG: cell envelope integrity protein TolA, partial [Paludibacter sp.]